MRVRLTAYIVYVPGDGFVGDRWRRTATADINPLEHAAPLRAVLRGGCTLVRLREGGARTHAMGHTRDYSAGPPERSSQNPFANNSVPAAPWFGVAYTGTRLCLMIAVTTSFSAGRRRRRQEFPRENKIFSIPFNFLSILFGFWESKGVLVDSALLNSIVIQSNCNPSRNRADDLQNKNDVWWVEEIAGCWWLLHFPPFVPIQCYRTITAKKLFHASLIKHMLILFCIRFVFIVFVQFGGIFSQILDFERKLLYSKK